MCRSACKHIHSWWAETLCCLPCCFAETDETVRHCCVLAWTHLWRNCSSQRIWNKRDPRVLLRARSVASCRKYWDIFSLPRTISVTFRVHFPPSGSVMANAIWWLEGISVTAEDRRLSKRVAVIPKCFSGEKNKIFCRHKDLQWGTYVVWCNAILPVIPLYVWVPVTHRWSLMALWCGYYCCRSKVDWKDKAVILESQLIKIWIRALHPSEPRQSPRIEGKKIYKYHHVSKLLGHIKLSYELL